MDCQQIASVRCRQATKIATLIFMVLGCLIPFVAAFAHTPGEKASDVLEQVSRYQSEYRSGNMDIVPAYVAMLEEATKAEPDNAEVWYAMGVAYLAQAARALQPGGNPPDAMSAMQKGPAALRRALQLDPDHAEALAQLGGVQALMGSFMQSPAMAARGVAQMNRAVELAPNSKRARLQRAFSGLSLPDTLRNHAAEAEDLDFLIEAAAWTRAGDYVTLMRADLYFETGKPDLARNLYEIVEQSTSPAAADAKARLSSLDNGGVAMSEIKALRTAAGAKCAMCHGR
jgi:tetratricopeptide (TPR) repeat protein